MRLFALLLAFVPCLATSQTADELRARYGKPVGEVFLVQPTITVAVAYSADGQPCRLLIETPRPLETRNEGTQLMPTKAVSALIDELMPPSERGQPLVRAATMENGCYITRMTLYATVTISRTQKKCDPASPDSPEGDVVTTITYKQRHCGVAQPNSVEMDKPSN
jgi:hypothetical protein